MFPKIGVPELIIILVIVLIIFGAGKLPQIGGAMGKAIRSFRSEVKGEGENQPQTKPPASEEEKKTTKS
jgi:sec-independent protein translocase protein TatA